MHHFYWLLELGLHPHTCHTYLPITQPFVTLNAHPVAFQCPSLVVAGHLNIIWNPGGDLGVPAFLHRLTAASDLETSVVGTGGWIRDESSWAKGGWSWCHGPKSRDLENLERPVDICWHLLTAWKKMHLNISQRFWSRSCLGACGDNFSTGVLWHFRIFRWLKTHALPSGKSTVCSLTLKIAYV